MNQLIGIVLLGAGAVFLYMGVAASDSFTSFWSKWYEGVPSDKALRLLTFGTISAIAGGFVLWSGRTKR